MISRINTAVCVGIDGCNVCVETDISKGLPSMNIVGLASTTVMEARERIKSAIINSGYQYPRNRITVNLMPADLRKNGSFLDLPIAIGVLGAAMYVDSGKAEKYGIIGELSLDGKVHGVDGVLPMIMCMAEKGFKKIILPYDNRWEAHFVENAEVIPVRSLNECVEIINDEASGNWSEKNECVVADKNENNDLDFSDIRGQETAKRAITIAVTGRHGMLMIGTPGCGKTMLAKRIPTIMPPMNRKEMIETAIVYSVTGRNNNESPVMIERPFRSPHHTIGQAGLLGGGNYPIPGEITLAHNGVLFLDEVCEFERERIESLRIPIEEKKITHFRNGIPYTFPCNFQMVMASNPCMCGFYGDTEQMCRCTQSQLEQYRRKLSGPMMDRIDLRIQMEKVSYTDISVENSDAIGSEQMRQDVIRGISFAEKYGRRIPNGDMTDTDIERYCRLGTDEEHLMEQAYKNLKLSPRSYRKVLKVARTIADIDESEKIQSVHLAEALSYRVLNEVNSETL